MPWIRVDVDVVDHPKTVKLARILVSELSQPKPLARQAAAGLVLQVWVYAAKWYPDGDLSEVDADHFKDQVRLRWEFVAQAFIECGWLDDGNRLHDWEEYQGRLMGRTVEEQRQYERDKKRAQRRKPAQSRPRNVPGDIGGQSPGDIGGQSLGDSPECPVSTDVRTDVRTGTSLVTTSPVELPAIETGEQLREFFGSMGREPPDWLIRYLVDLVWVYARERLKYGKQMLLPERRQKIVTRLKAYGWQPDPLLYAIDATVADPHRQGENDRNRKYTSVESIFRNGAVTDELANRSERYQRGEPHRFIQVFVTENPPREARSP